MKLEPTSVEVAAISAEMGRIWGDVRASPKLTEFVKQHGGSETDLRELAATTFVAEYEGAPIDPVLTPILVKAAAPVVAKIAYDVWRAFILPRLQSRFGADKIKESR